MKITVLTGGVGGAKFVLGLERCGLVDELTAIVNTGDDFRHLGLYISPDIDTLLYTLSGKSNRTLGWGREGESWHFLDAVRSLHGPDWFQLGDGDLALHVLRSDKLARGESLSAITAQFAQAWGVSTRIVPMSDSSVATVVDTDEGELAFQRYFVARRCEPAVCGVRFNGADTAKAAPGVVEVILDADAVFIAPSNPYLSIDPILAIAEIAQALRSTKAPVVAISPIVGGQAVKGPTTKMMAELGVASTNDAIVAHYAGIIDALLHDDSDAAPANLLSQATSTLMRTLEDKRRVAMAAVQLAQGVVKK